ncbi:MAG: dihydrofolate reductase [Chitinophagales bacterium]|nr:dihydrofolate reductase [Sphingobacteriales bacterium]
MDNFQINIIVAYSSNLAIGKNNNLLWHLVDDMAFFKQQTSGKTVVMGKNTYLSLPKKFRPLPNRKNIVISRQEPIEEHENLYWYKSLEEAISALKKTEDEIYIIGGGTIYEQTLPMADVVYATEVKVEIEGDTYFPPLNPQEWTREVLHSFLKNEINEYDFEVVKYVKI